MNIRFRRVDWEYVSVFRIAYRVETHAQTVLVELEEDGLVGRGEAVGVPYHDENVETLLAQLASISGRMHAGMRREELATLLPAGGARNAVDCALWDVEAKRLGRRAWDLAGLQTMRPLHTAFTFGLDELAVTVKAAAAATQYPLLKLKLGGDDDLERVRSVRKVRPDARIIVDANQAWSVQQLHEFTPQLAELGVQLIEQPLPAGNDDALAAFVSPVPLCADESCQTSDSLPQVLGKYQYVNIKLDKTGGLTEALRLARLAREQGFKLMVGCMGGSSIAMAPAFIIGQWCDVVDLDSPLLSKSDVPYAIRYDGNRMSVPDAHLWG